MTNMIQNKGKLNIVITTGTKVEILQNDVFKNEKETFLVNILKKLKEKE